MTTQSLRIDETVPEERAGQRFDRVLAGLVRTASRTELSRAIKEGRITLNGAVVPPRTAVKGGERIEGVLERAPRFDWQSAEAIDLNVAYEDEHLLVIDKPPGLVVHPGAGHGSGTMVNGLLRHRPSLAQLPRAGLVHRIDKDTSGLLLVAATGAAYQALGEAMRSRRIERLYLAVCEGTPDFDERRIDEPIGRDPRRRTRQAIRADGRSASTILRVRERFAAHALLAAKLETGRTHQVRVHAAAIRHPLVGDRQYGARDLLPKGASPDIIETVRGFTRQALHAHRLRFRHPATNRALSITSPLPEDMEDLLAALRGS